MEKKWAVWAIFGAFPAYYVAIYTLPYDFSPSISPPISVLTTMSYPSESDYEAEERRLRQSNVIAARRRNIAKRRGSATCVVRGRRPSQQRHDGEAGSSRAWRAAWLLFGDPTAATPPLPLPPPFTESSGDDGSYSSLKSPSTDDGKDLLKIVDQNKMDARVFTKSVRSERRV